MAALEGWGLVRIGNFQVLGLPFQAVSGFGLRVGLLPGTEFAFSGCLGVWASGFAVEG